MTLNHRFCLDLVGIQIHKNWCQKCWFFVEYIGKYNLWLVHVNVILQWISGLIQSTFSDKYWLLTCDYKLICSNFGVRIPEYIHQSKSEMQINHCNLLVIVGLFIGSYTRGEAHIIYLKIIKYNSLQNWSNCLNW